MGRVTASSIFCKQTCRVIAVSLAGGPLRTCSGGAAGHAGLLVQAAVLHPRLAGVAEAGEGFAAVVRAPLEHHVHHALQLVLPAEQPAGGARHVAGGLLGAARVVAVLVAHVHHARLDVVLAEQPPGLACMGKCGIGSEPLWGSLPIDHLGSRTESKFLHAHP